MNQQKQFSVVEKLFIIMAWKVNGMSQGAAYEGWSDAYARKSAREYWTDSTRQLQGWTFGIDDLQQVSVRDLKFLGFRQWDADDSMLLPLWLYPHMKKGEQWFNIRGNPVELCNEIDLEICGGCIACWFKHEPVAVIETIDQMFNDRLEYQPTETDPEKLIQNMEAEAWAAGMSGGEDDDELVIHPHRDDEHQ